VGRLDEDSPFFVEDMGFDCLMVLPMERGVRVLGWVHGLPRE